MTVCIATENSTISSFVSKGFAQTDTNLHKAECAKSVFSLLEQHSLDALIVDLDIDGVEELLAHVKNLPVVALVHTKHPYEGEPVLPEASARVKKPFCLAEITQGIITARNSGKTPAPLQLGDLVLDCNAGTVRREGRSLRFYPQGLLLLEHFMRNPEKVISRKYILENFFDYTANPRPNLVDVLISRMRSALDKGFTTPMLTTVRRQGYQLRP